jgi:peptide-methionine (S)-S-oxide reductase
LILSSTSLQGLLADRNHDAGSLSVFHQTEDKQMTSLTWHQLILGLVFAALPAHATAEQDSPDIAIFAGGCFWCMEPPFDNIEGVLSTTSGYTDGQLENPSYKQVSRGATGHTEALKVEYDSSIVSYEQLLEAFWVNIDPVAENRQFCDAGSQYRSGIYYRNDQQKAAALASLDRLKASGRFEQAIATEIKPATTFYPAEEYHQDYYIKNPIRYKFYRYNCGRDARLDEIWGEDR